MLKGAILQEQIDYAEPGAVIARWNKYMHFNFPLHFHDEYELVYIVESSGTSFVGDSVSKYKPGNIFFWGSRLPHTIKNDIEFTHSNSNKKARAIIIQLHPHFGVNANKQPELHNIHNLLGLSARGICFNAAVGKSLHEQLVALPDINNHFERYIQVLSIINTLSIQQEFTLLSSKAFSDSLNAEIGNRITTTLEFIAENYSRVLNLEEVASLNHMSVTAFCNFFKRKTGKTLVSYLNNYRISKACQMLIDSEDSIAEIAYLCGFNNISNFNRIFRNIVKQTPKEYRASK